MDHLFGHLRSLLHGEPSAESWRRIWRLLARADAARAHAELIPYADELLDARWPDALRTTVHAWAGRMREDDAPPLPWPLARTLTQLPDAALVAKLDAGDHLRAIKHITLGQGDINAPLHALLSVASLSLRSFAYHGRMPTQAPHALLMERHPLLESLALNTWEYPQRVLALPIGEAELAHLHTLNLLHTQIDRASTLDLLYTSGLPALRHLALNTRREGEPQAPPVLAATPIIAQLDTLALRFNEPAFLQTLQARSGAPPLAALTLDGRINATSANALAEMATPAPEQLTLVKPRLDGDALRNLLGWSALDGVRALELIRPAARDVAITPLLAALASNARIERLALRELVLAQLTTQRWPTLRALALEDCVVNPSALAQLPRALPAIEELALLNTHGLGPLIEALLQLDTFEQLRALDLLNSPLSPDTQISLISALHAHPTLEALNLTSCGLTNLRLRQLARTPIPRLHTLRLGRIKDITDEDITQLCAAPWLPQLRLLKLDLKQGDDDAPMRAVNLRALLIQHGARPDAQISY
jgi:hypothetical protein